MVTKVTTILTKVIAMVINIYSGVKEPKDNVTGEEIEGCG
jgi:hypothetical protein